MILKDGEVPRFRILEFLHNNLHRVVDVNHHGRRCHEIPHVGFRIQFLIKHHFTNVIQQDNPQQLLVGIQNRE